MTAGATTETYGDDFAPPRQAAGPVTAHQLRMFGAEVIKVEDVGGDVWRSGGGLIRYQNGAFEGCDATHNSASGNLVQAWPLTEAADDVELKGNAAYHSNFCLRFDGKGDRAIITPATDYTASGSFTIVFWATQSSCKLSSTWEVLFAQGQDLWNTGSSISVMMQCWGSTPQLSAWVKTGAPGQTGPSAGLQPLATPDVLRCGGDISANWIVYYVGTFTYS